MRPPTPMQAECLNAIKRLTTADGVVPSYQQIADVMGLSSKSCVHRLVHGLIERGWLAKRGQWRSLEVIEPAASAEDPAVKTLAILLAIARPGADGIVTLKLTPGLAAALRRAIPVPTEERAA